LDLEPVFERPIVIDENVGDFHEE
jgi:hypothetical protein